MTTGEILTALPQIYQALQSAWVADDFGFFSVPADTLIVACDTACTPVAGVTTKTVFSLLMEGHPWEPSCTRYFARENGALYWPCSWAQMYWFSLKRPVIDLSWQIAHGLLHKGYHLVISFGMAYVPTACLYSPLRSRPLTSCFSPTHLLRLCCPGCSPSRLFAQPLFHL